MIEAITQRDIFIEYYDSPKFGNVILCVTEEFLLTNTKFNQQEGLDLDLITKEEAVRLFKKTKDKLENGEITPQKIEVGPDTIKTVIYSDSGKGAENIIKYLSEESKSITI